MIKWLQSHKIVLCIILLGFIVRLYRFDNPIADWHSWRQADTSAVSRNFIKNGFDILHPRYDDISNIQSGKDNIQGYRFVEFPIYNVFQAIFYKYGGFLTLEEWGRLVTIISSLFSAFFLYLLVRKHMSEKEGYFAAFFFLFLPYSIYYSRTILPDEMMVSAVLGGTYFFDKYLEHYSKKSAWKYLIPSLILTSASFLLKPYALFFTLPLLYLAWEKFGTKLLFKWPLWVYGVLSITPLIWWRMWMTQYPEGIPVNTWLFNGGDVRFKLYWFRWILYERLIKLILGFSGSILFLFGLISWKKEKSLFFTLSFLLSSIIYVFVIARGNLQHDYYQILIIPSLCILMSRGVSVILSFSHIRQEVRVTSTIVLIGISFLFSGFQIKDYFNVNNQAMIRAGRKADQLLPKNAKVIAPLDGDTSFLYQINRKGWPAFEKGPDDLKKLGAGYLILLNPTDQDYNGFGKKYTIISKDNSYLILKL